MAPIGFHHQRAPQCSPKWVSNQMSTPQTGAPPPICPRSHAGPRAGKSFKICCNLVALSLLFSKLVLLGACHLGVSLKSQGVGAMWVFNPSLPREKLRVLHPDSGSHTASGIYGEIVSQPLLPAVTGLPSLVMCRRHSASS